MVRVIITVSRHILKYAFRCYWINVASLICGFLGNLFLLLNFTQRIRYIIALPATIIFWYLSSGFLIAITVCMDVYVPPNRPTEGWRVLTQVHTLGVVADNVAVSNLDRFSNKNYLCPVQYLEFIFGLL